MDNLGEQRNEPPQQQTDDSSDIGHVAHPDKTLSWGNEVTPKSMRSLRADYGVISLFDGVEGCLPCSRVRTILSSLAGASRQRAPLVAAKPKNSFLHAYFRVNSSTLSVACRWVYWALPAKQTPGSLRNTAKQSYSDASFCLVPLGSDVILIMCNPTSCAM